MAWLVDPKKWDDAWHRGLSLGGKVLWDACITSRLRLSLPGLIPNASEFTFSDAIGEPIEIVRAALAELQRPDLSGTQHIFFDPVHRVIRIPAAPKYNKADNPNILRKWFKEWCDAPNCQLRWDHLDSLPAGVNFRLQTMAAEWGLTFGRVLAEYRQGRKLTSYAELQGEDDHLKRSRKPSRNGSTEKGSGNGLPGGSQPSGQPSRGSEHEHELEHEHGSGSGSNGFGNRWADHNDSSTLELPESEQKALQHGRKAPTPKPVRVSGGSDPHPRDPESHPATASPARRREFELAGWRLSPFGLWIPPGLD